MVTPLEELPPCVHLQHRDHRWLGGSGGAAQGDPDAVFPSPELPHQPQPPGDWRPRVNQKLLTRSPAHGGEEREEGGGGKW